MIYCYTHIIPHRRSSKALLVGRMGFLIFKSVNKSVAVHTLFVTSEIYHYDRRNNRSYISNRLLISRPACPAYAGGATILSRILCALDFNALESEISSYPPSHCSMINIVPGIHPKSLMNKYASYHLSYGTTHLRNCPPAECGRCSCCKGNR